MIDLLDARDVALVEAALVYARRGWPVFPCAGKVPAIDGGFKAASLDEQQLRDWWQRMPTANIGLPVPGGFWVLDVDGEEGRLTLRELERRHAPLPFTLRAVTGSGGEHWVFVGVARQAARFAPGLDTRSAGKGYIVVAPSVHPTTKRAYEWLMLAPPVEPPQWLAAMVAPARESLPVPYEPPPRGSVGASRRERYARAALDRIAADLATTGEGRRNAELNRAWFRVGQFADVLSKSEARAVLLNAAIASGLSSDEAEKVLR